jgi:hypothetical protein
MIVIDFGSSRFSSVAGYMIGGGAFSNKVFQDSVHLGSDIEKLVRVV